MQFGRARLVWLLAMGVACCPARSSAQTPSDPPGDRAPARADIVEPEAPGDHETDPPGDHADEAARRLPTDAAPDAAPDAAQAAANGDEDEEEREDDEDDEAREEEDEERRHSGAPRYFFEGVELKGNHRTQAGVIRGHIPLRSGDVIDVDSGTLEAIEWSLRGTGWFDDVRLRLRRGSQRGWVIVVVEVIERNTMVIRDLVLGLSEGLAGRRDPSTEIVPYVGFSIAETNLSGSGVALSLAGLMSQQQQGAQIGFVAPTVLSSPYSLRAGVFMNNARQFFGRDPLISQTCPPDLAGCLEEVEAKNAVVFYRRGGLRVGTGRAVGSSTHYSIDWQGEIARVRSRPEAASFLRGDEVTPVDFSIEDGTSFVSVLRLGLLYDRRDDPALTNAGTFVRIQGDLGSRILGSTYEFVRFQGLARYYHSVAPRHVLRFGAFLGVVFGDAPFFYKFHVSDLTDLLPSRVLEMELDRRPANDFFGTAIRVMRNEEIAWRLDVQYDFAAYRTLRRPALRGLNLYLNVGVYGLADPQDFRVGVSGFDGFSRVPIDLTFDLGIRAETTIGVFQFGFSNLLGFIAL